MLEETGERQVKSFLKDIDLAHRERYAFASELIYENYKVADVGCGIGYGSYIMATTTPCESILAIDISEEAIVYAKENYSNKKIIHKTCNILKEAIGERFNLITAFEVVEHIDEAFEFLCALNKLLDDDGVIVLTTPNESVLPFSKENFSFHVRHYHPDELLNLIQRANFELIFRGSQNGRGIYGFDGNAFNVFICRKKGTRSQVELKNVIQDTPFHRAMADYEKIDWLLFNAPQPDYDTIFRGILNRKFEDKGISEYIIQRIDSHRRTYMPQILNDNPSFGGVLGELRRGMIVKQSLTAGIDNLCGLAVLPGLYGTVFKGTVFLSIYDNQRNLIGFQSFTKVKDNQLLKFEFAPIDKSQGEEFLLEIYICSLEEETQLTFYTTKPKNDFLLEVNGEKVDSTLTFRTIYI